MDWQAWRKALVLYANTPELIYGSILVAIAAFGFAWWLRSRISKKRIAALHEQLRLGKQVQEHITNELQSLKQKVSLEETTINNLRSAGGVPRKQVELLSNANATVVSSLYERQRCEAKSAPTLLPFAIPRCSSLQCRKMLPALGGRENVSKILKTLGNLTVKWWPLPAISENLPANRLQGNPVAETLSLATASSATQSCLRSSRPT